MNLKIGIFLASTAIGSFSALACGPENVKLDKIRGQIDYHYLTVFGVLTHDCPEPVGIQMKLVVYDAAGNIVDLGEPWPASIRNIAPRKPFTFSVSGTVRGKKNTFTIEPIAVKQWRER